MKRLLVLTTLLAVLAGTNEIHAQAWLRQLGNSAKNAAKRSVEKNVEKAVEKAVDKSFSAAEKATEDAISKGIEESEAKREARRAKQQAGDTTAATQPQPDDAAQKAARRAEAIKVFTARPSGGAPFYPVKKGLVMTYATGTGKGKPASYTRSTIVDIQWQDERNYSVVTSSEILDADMNPVTSEPMTAGATVQNGVVTYDPGTMVGQLTAGMEISGDFFFLPDNINVGDVLPDYTITINIGGLKTVSENVGLKVTGQETLTVGDYDIDCYVIENSSSVTAFGIKSQATMKTWYGRGIGQVRQESYNKNGKLTSVYELVELKGY